MVLKKELAEFLEVIENCKDCKSWFGNNRPEYSYTGCELGLTNLELSYFYLEDELVKRKTGFGRICSFFERKAECQ